MSRARVTGAALVALALIAFSASSAQAQNATLTGKVSTQFGQPLEGANVFITELTISVATNAQGNYTIIVPAARVAGQQVVLRVRSFGWVQQQRPIRLTPGSQTADFTLRQDINRLQEVVVTGVTAGTQQKDLPFTVNHVDDREMPVPESNPLTQIQGKVPGANIVSSSGRPGSAPTVLLRGPKSINGQGRGQQPLYIIDGVILQGGVNNSFNPLADINPQDIQSVEVIEGAAASSLYGSRAGNGVISITTKSGTSAASGIKFSLRSEYGAGDIERQFPLAQNHFLQMNETHTLFCVRALSGDPAGAPPCARVVDIAKEAARVNNNGQPIALGAVGFQNDAGIAQQPLGKDNDEQREFQVGTWPVVYDPVGQAVTPGQHVNNTIDATGRVGGTSFFASANNYYEQGAIRFLNGTRRSSLRVNVDQNIGEALTFGVRSYYARSSADGANDENGNGFFRLTRSPVGVNLLARDNLGDLYIRSNPLNQGIQNGNPLYIFQNDREMDKSDHFIGSANGQYTALSWLQFTGDVSYDHTGFTAFHQRDKGYRATSSASSSDPLGFQYQEGDANQSINTSLSGLAHRTFGQLDLRYTARYLYEQQDFNQLDFSGTTLAVGGLGTGDAVTASQAVSSGQQSIRSLGLMTGVDATWADRYILSTLFRRDGSSLFGSNTRWANYGRAALAWRVSEEPWWIFPALNDFKLRASVGTAGGRPSFTAQYETYTIGTGGTLTKNTLGNKNLRPETTFETEYGIDAELLHRYGLNLTYAHDITTDQILPVPQPAIAGASTQWQNAGTLDNKTIEASLNVPLITRRNVNWSARLSYDHTSTFITKLNVLPFFQGTGQQGTNTMFQFAQGLRFAELYGRKFATSCGDLPTAFQAQCGPGKQWQKNDQGLIVWTGGHSLGEGITNNLWGAELPASQAPWGVKESWGLPIIVRDANANAIQAPLGNALPTYRLGLSQTFNYKKLFVYGQLDGSFGQSVWNEGRHWSLGDFTDREEDQGGKSVQDAKPIGYYWRAGPPDNVGIGGLYDLLGPTNVTVEKASYAKIREVQVAYNVGPVRGVGDWTVSLIGRNLHTFTNYTGFDPEVGLTNVGSNYVGSSSIAAVDAFNFPNVRSYTLALSTRF